MKFIYYWIPELRGYSLSEILAGAYINESPYPAPILDWAQTRKVNGKIISNLRKRVKQRLLAEQGEEYQQAAMVAQRTAAGIALRIVDKYWETRDKQYREYNQKISSYHCQALINLLQSLNS